MTENSRLTRADFSATLASKRFHGALFSLSASPLSRERSTSFACVVSKRIAQKAARRNLIKRRCREAVRACLRTVPSETNLALVFRAKKNAASATFSEIRDDVASLIERAVSG